MKAQQKTIRMFQIMNQDWGMFYNWEFNFFELNSYEIGLFAEMAELFGIKSTNGKSPARTLYDRLKKFYNKQEK